MSGRGGRRGGGPHRGRGRACGGLAAGDGGLVRIHVEAVAEAEQVIRQR